MIQVVAVSSKSLRKEFIEFPYRFYKHDPHWIPPLKIERKEMIDPKKNPFFQNAEACLFLAFKDGKPVGRISAQINRLHNERYAEKTGHFGFFDCVDDPLVSAALFEEASRWLKSRGMEKICGPMSFSINEEVGVLVDGFDSPPFPFMAHNPPYYDRLIGSSGFVKVKELLAWRYDSRCEVPEAARRIAEAVCGHPGLVIREMNLKRMEDEIRIVSDIFNSAWSKNWGFIPWTEAEIKKGAKDLKMILDPKIALIAEVNGIPAAISIAIPNYHEAIRDLNGRLFPFGIFKFLYRLKRRKIKSARVALLGIKKEFRAGVLGGLAVLLYVEMRRRSRELGYWNSELSWTLEDNEKINHGIGFMGAEVYKKYRVYEKEL
ncbi:MAG: N-acetyltransferase [Deltaproteobacteria bacterium]|nr:N-acetyltransferase [Deltaproteobacteria bacterium]